MGTWSWERVPDRTSWSQGFFRLVGVDASSVRPSLSFFESLAHPQDRLPFGDSRRIATDPRQENRRLRIIRPDGQLRWIWSTARTIFDREGAVSRVIGIAKDVTETEELRRRVTSGRDFLVAISRLMHVEFWTADPSGELLDFSAWFKDESEGSANVLAKGWQSLVPPEALERIYQKWKEAVATHSPYIHSGPIELPDGSLQTVYVHGVPFDDLETEEPRWIGVATTRPGVVATGATEIRAEPNALTPAHLRAARAFLGWSADEMAARAGVSLSTVRRLEADQRTSVRKTSLTTIRRALEKAGLSFAVDRLGRLYFVQAAPGAG